MVVDSAHWRRIQDNAQDADRAMVSDAIGVGIAWGLDVTQTGTPSMSVQVSDGVAYDFLGRRIEVSAPVTVSLATDSASASTAVGSGQERFVALYIRWKAVPAAPVTIDGTTSNTELNESFELVVVSGAVATLGAGLMPAAPSGNPLLLARVRIRYGTTTIGTNDLMFSSVPLLHRNADLYAESPARFFEASPADPPDMTVKVTAGRATLDGTQRVFAGGTTAAFTAPATNPRIDLIALNNAGALTVVAGTEASSPTPPTANGVLPLWHVTLAPGQTAILDTHLSDARPFLRAQTARRQSYEFVPTAGQSQIDLPFSYVPGAHAIELSVNGALQPEASYVETTPTRITVAPFIGTERVMVRVSEIAPLGVVALEQVTDDLSGLLAGGDTSFEDRGAGLRLHVEPIVTCVLARRSLRTLDTTSVALAGLSPSSWYCVYATNSAGALAFSTSNILPERSSTWRSDTALARTHRLLCHLRTDSSGVPLPFHRRGGVTLYDVGAIASTSDLNAVSAGSSMTWATVSLGQHVPDYVRHALIEVVVEAGSGIAPGAEVRTYGSTGGVLTVTLEAITGASQTARREAWVCVDSLRRLEYRLKTGYGGLVTIRVLGYRF